MQNLSEQRVVTTYQTKIFMRIFTLWDVVKCHAMLELGPKIYDLN